MLTTLMILQSMSSVVLSHYEQLIQENVFLALFLTMLIGTGGNAGNQSSSLVIRGMSTGEINTKNMLKVLLREVLASSAIGLILAAAAFVRVMITHGSNITAAFIVSAATFLTIVGAIAGGTVVPLALERAGLDPCHISSPMLATLTDIMGVLILCMISSAILGKVG